MVFTTFCPAGSKNHGIYSVSWTAASNNTGIYAVFNALQEAVFPCQSDKNIVNYSVLGSEICMDEVANGKSFIETQYPKNISSTNTSSCNTVPRKGQASLTPVDVWALGGVRVDPLESP